MIKAIIFDFDSTLVDFHHSDDASIRLVVDMTGKKIDYNEFNEYSIKILYDLYNTNKNISENIHKYRIKETLDHYNIPWDEKYLNEYLGIYLNNVPVYDGVINLLEKLYRNIKIGLLTNSIDGYEQRKRIENSKLLKYFSKIGIACEIGSFKPDKKAFEWIINELDIKKEEAIFIGDSEKHDIEGSINAGIKCIRKINNQSMETKANQCFINYTELDDILKNEYAII